jgi:hypothetical protein
MGLETALAIGAVAAGVGSAGASIAGAAGAGGGGGGGINTTQIPLSPETKALQEISARQLLAASQYRPPSLLDFAAAGGEATGPDIPGPTAFEAMQLGLITPSGRPVSFYKGGVLTPQQALQAQREKLRLDAGLGPTGPVDLGLTTKLAKTTERIREAKAAGDTDALAKLQKRRKKIKGKIAESYRKAADKFDKEHKAKTGQPDARGYPPIPKGSEIDPSSWIAYIDRLKAAGDLETLNSLYR